MFKNAYGAGHYLDAGQYEDVELLRVNDPAGIERILVEGRYKAANDWARR